MWPRNILLCICCYSNLCSVSPNFYFVWLLQVLDLLKTAFGRKQQNTYESHDKSYPMGSVLISALRLVDVFSDDSNFRSSFMTNTVCILLSSYFHKLLCHAFSLESLFKPRQCFISISNFAGSLFDPDSGNSSWWVCFKLVFSQSTSGWGRCKSRLWSV